MIEAQQILEALFQPSAIIRPRPSQYGKPELELKEPRKTTEPGESGEAEYVVLIRDIPSDAWAIKADLFTQPQAIFRGSKGECKRADYILISEEKKKIIFIELKQTKESTQRNHIIEQLKGAHCLMHYCQEIVCRFWGVSNFLHGCDKRYVHINGPRPSVNKRSTCAKARPTKHDSPENHMRIAHKTYISFNELAA
jgi:hypothetical protein